MKGLWAFVFFACIAKSLSLQCQGIQNNARIDCHPEPGASESRCVNRGCCWEIPEINEYIPYCHFPSDFPAYQVVSGGYIPNGFIGSIEKKQPTFRPGEILKLHLNVTFDTDSRLRFRITDPNASRFEVPVVLNHKTSYESTNDNTRHYTLTINSDPFFIKVLRKSNNKVIFDTSIAPFVFADQYIQFSTSLVSDHFYGIGEHRDRFAHPTDWQSFTFWNRDVPPGVNRNLYGTHPFYLAMDDDSQAMGFFFLNSNGMDVNVQPYPALTFTTIGGVIDFYLYLGSEPKEVVSQHIDVVGKPFFPPYFSLGFHLCRWKYNNNAKLKHVIQRNRAAEMPYDVQWVDIDSMSMRLDWTYDTERLSELPEIVEDLHHNGQHYINIIDPAIAIKKGYEPYETGMKAEVFVKKYNSDEPIKGLVWPGPTVYPDFTNPNTSTWWESMASGFHDKIPYDGIWIDMNEPSNFMDGSDEGCLNNTYDNPPYVPKVLDGSLSAKTLCPSSRQYLSNHYNLHNMYGHFEAIATYNALKKIRKNKRPFVLTRSSFAGTGQYAAHWSGDNDANWNDLFYSIPNMLNFNMFGVTMVGSDICGFSSDTTEELCIRWMQLGSFYPFMRNHNNDVAIDQDPAVFSYRAQDIIRNALNTRYTLLPYLYNLLYLSHTRGETVVRPLFFEYPRDKKAQLIDRQFMFGQAFLISPVLTKGTTTVDAYFPDDTWYKYSNGELIKMNGSVYVTLDAPIEEINVHIRGGHIVPYQFPSVTTTASRRNPFGLIVALKRQNDDLSTASGEMYWDDGESFDSIQSGSFNKFRFESRQKSDMGLLEIARTDSGYNVPMILDEIKIFGVVREPKNLTIGNKPYENFEYSEIYKRLDIRFFNMEMNVQKPASISWVF